MIIQLFINKVYMSPLSHLLAAWTTYHTSKSTLSINALYHINIIIRVYYIYPKNDIIFTILIYTH